MGLHRCDQDRFSFKMSAAFHERIVCRLNVLDLEVKDRARMIQVRPLWNREHQANPVAIEESHLRRHTEKMFHPKYVFVKRRGARQVVHVDTYLPDLT